MNKITRKSKIAILAGILSAFLSCIWILGSPSSRAQPLQESGSVGIEGTVPANPPANAPTITVPSNGQSFTALPITVSGLCQKDLLVEVFRNNVFAGSITCSNNNYSMKIDLFSGANDLFARQYDELNQPSPDSNVVRVTFNTGTGLTSSRISLLTAFAKRGANSTLTWPLAITGGQGPYAVGVDWGDGTETDLISRPIPGDFQISHDYKPTGSFNIIIRATDANGLSAFLQVVGVHNGPIQQTGDPDGQSGIIFKEKLPLAFWIVVGVSVPLMLTTFWLGKRHEVQTIRSKIKRGNRPF